ncbi:Outer membrane lipoprotein-sorting protein [Terriglobus roseus]|uniref:Outer membrane lipoprotein-sorting protein n=2 Tax=Terriglobus roseus TaxID=392734 RepID=A0A1G7PJ32_9BACT|nr:Outer membrane lipoprotein-sorting protein [Terriglobus roseus]
MKHARRNSILLLALLPALGGCLRTTRSVMKTHPPDQVLTSSLDQVVKSTSDRYNSIKTLKASVEMQASTGGGKQGKVVDYTSFNGYILIRKPGDFHFLGLLPAIHTRMIDMVTNGQTFTLVIPPKSRAVTGSNTITTPSKNPLENLRPDMFTDSLLIQSAKPEELVSMTSDDRIYQPDPTKKYIVDEPEYEFGIYRPVQNSQELKTQRVIHIGRSTLLPYQQDIYDEKGQLVTVANYSDYKMFGDTTFASKITIRRPLDEITLNMTITELSVNQPLEDDQFEAPKIPASYSVERLP